MRVVPRKPHPDGGNGRAEPFRGAARDRRRRRAPPERRVDIEAGDRKDDGRAGVLRRRAAFARPPVAGAHVQPPAEGGVAPQGARAWPERPRGRALVPRGGPGPLPGGRRRGARGGRRPAHSRGARAEAGRGVAELRAPRDRRGAGPDAALRSLRRPHARLLRDAARHSASGRPVPGSRRAPPPARCGVATCPLSLSAPRSESSGTSARAGST